MWLQILSYTLMYVIKILYFRIPRNTLCCPSKFAWTIVLKCSLEYCIFPKAFEDNNPCKIWGANRVYYGRLQNSQLTNRPFSHDVTSAILVFQNNETAARLVSQTSPVGDEPFYFFCSNKFAKLLATWVKTLYSWFATTWQGGHVGGRYNRIFSRAIYMKIEFSFQRREMVLFLTTNMAAVT